MELLKAFVLHTRPYRDSSMLVDLLVRDQGRVSVVARGIRRQSNRSQGNACQPFRELLVSFKGRGNLKTLVGLEQGRGFYPLNGDTLYAGLYANELLIRALHETDPHPELFDAYHRLLLVLSELGDGSLEPPLRNFERLLLEQTGYGIDFSHDGDSGEFIGEDGLYVFIAETGFVEVASAHAARGRMVYRGEDLAAIASGTLEAEVVRKAAKRLMREALVPLVGEKPLQTRELFRARSPRI